MHWHTEVAVPVNGDEDRHEKGTKTESPVLYIAPQGPFPSPGIAASARIVPDHPSAIFGFRY